jgi:hypothetical protein
MGGERRGKFWARRRGGMATDWELAHEWECQFGQRKLSGINGVPMPTATGKKQNGRTEEKVMGLKMGNGLLGTKTSCSHSKGGGEFSSIGLRELPELFEIHNFYATGHLAILPNLIVYLNYPRSSMNKEFVENSKIYFIICK